VIKNPGRRITVNRWRHWEDIGQVSEMMMLLACLVAAAALRLSFAVNEPLSVDEAESSINALSILEHGYPADHYLGMPLYENVLLTTSPDSKEYEFRNSSHSGSGKAINQGWLPLYSIAAAFAAARIQPDVNDGRPPAARHTIQDLRRRTIVPRIPSIVFATLFLFFVFQLGRTISGGDTAWSVVVAVAFAQPLVWSGWHARDYSATLAVASLSGLAVWNLTRRGTWRDAILAGLAFVFLFHTQRLTFMILSAVLLANVPFGLNLSSWRSKLLLTGAITAAGIVPWLYWTDFLDATARTPMAWPLLAFPGDFVSWFVTRKAFMGAIGLVIALPLLSASFPRQRLARSIIGAADDRQALYFTMSWFVIAYLAFIFLSTAESFVNARLMVVLAIPGYLLFAQCVAIAARTLTPGFAVVTAPLAVLAFLGVRGAAVFTGPPPATPDGVAAFVDTASRWTLEPGTRVYAWPNENLLLTYVSGLPVQSIAPVRKAFLDEYPGDVIFVETGTPYAESALKDVQAIASQQGAAWSLEEARQAAHRVQRFGARQYLNGLVTNVSPPSEPMGPIDPALIARYTEQTLQAGRETAAEYRLLRGFAPTSRLTSHLLPLYYRFVNPEMHLGDQLNYRDRIRGATAIVLPNGSIIFDARRNRDVPLVDRARYLAILRGTSTAGL
jgi:hypothetical protein